MVDSKVVCVTGASGFIASWVVKLLLERGYTVKGTVRNYEKSKHLLQLPGASERLQLIEADLVKPGAFDSVVEGCEGVFHTASPVPEISTNAKDPDAEIIDPALKGTLNVLQSCAKSRPKRIVLTSSVVSVLGSSKVSEDGVLDESFFSDPDSLRKNKNWYALSKILAELAAWDFVKEHNLDMVAILPSWVIGPVLQGSMNATMNYFRGFVDGTTKTIPNSVAGWVGVKDVALAHILVYEKPEAKGRHICSESQLYYDAWISKLKKLYPEYRIVAKVPENTPRDPLYTFSNEKLKKLGLHFTPLEEVMQESVTCLKELKYLD